MKPTPPSLLLCLALAPPALAAQTGAADSFADLSIEALGDVVVTSVVRQEGHLADAPASLYVISASDIRRSGAVTLTDALRLAPNLFVAQADSRNFAITARGAASTLADKMLVLIDGRSVYSPLFSGVFWDVQDVMLEDIERIEVISGPGATIWGANAVNGVINILTRPASATQGGRASVDVGNRARGAAVRYGATAGAGMHYRLYAKRQLLDNAVTASGDADGTAIRREQAGARMDWVRGADTYTFSGDIYQGRLGQPGLPSIATSGANAMARMVRHIGAHEQLRVQVYYDRTDRHQQGGGGGDRVDTIDGEIQHGRRFGERHNVVWGAGYRTARDVVEQGPVFKFYPGYRRMKWANLFAQDEIVLNPTLRLTLGLKVERNPYTGNERLPNARLAWQATGNSLVWAGLSRSVRSPARIDRDLYVAGAASGLPFDIAGGPQFESEKADVMELGYRSQADLWTFSATAFASDFEQLRTLEPVGADTAQFLNKAAGRSRGLEAWGTLRLGPSWRIDAGGVVQRIRKQWQPDSVDLTAYAGLGTNDPAHYWKVRSTHELSEAMTATLHWRKVGRLPAPAVPSYHELDASLVWQVGPRVELALVGRNLLRPQHLEYSPAGARQFVARSIHASAFIQF